MVYALETPGWSPTVALPTRVYLLFQVAEVGIKSGSLSLES